MGVRDIRAAKAVTKVEKSGENWEKITNKATKTTKAATRAVDRAVAGRSVGRAMKMT